MPLIVIAQSPDKAAAEAGLERWKQQHAEAAALLAPDDVLVDRMRGSAYVWYRIRVNLRHVPERCGPRKACLIQMTIRHESGAKRRKHLRSAWL